MLLVAQAWRLGRSRARSLHPPQLCHWLAGNLGGGAVNLFLQPILDESHGVRQDSVRDWTPGAWQDTQVDKRVKIE